MEENNIKYCKFCANPVHIDAVMRPKCGRQIEELKTAPQAAQQPIIINNSANAAASASAVSYAAGPVGVPKNKWVAFILRLFLGVFGAHKFYEGKIGMGILYLFTMGIGGIGVIIDLIIILTKPSIYYV